MQKQQKQQCQGFQVPLLWSIHLSQINETTQHQVLTRKWGVWRWRVWIGKWLRT